MGAGVLIDEVVGWGLEGLPSRSSACDAHRPASGSSCLSYQAPEPAPETWCFWRPAPSTTAQDPTTIKADTLVAALAGIGIIMGAAVNWTQVAAT